MTGRKRLAEFGRGWESGLPEAIAPALAPPDAMVATACGRSLLLAMAGLLESRRVVTHPRRMEILAANGALATPARAVDDGNLEPE